MRLFSAVMSIVASFAKIFQRNKPSAFFRRLISDSITRKDGANLMKRAAMSPSNHQTGTAMPKHRGRLLLALAVALPILSLLAGAAVAALQYGVL